MQSACSTQLTQCEGCSFPARKECLCVHKQLCPLFSGTKCEICGTKCEEQSSAAVSMDTMLLSMFDGESKEAAKEKSQQGLARRRGKRCVLCMKFTSSSPPALYRGSSESEAAPPIESASAVASKHSPGTLDPSRCLWHFPLSFSVGQRLEQMVATTDTHALHKRERCRASIQRFVIALSLWHSPLQINCFREAAQGLGLAVDGITVLAAGPARRVPS